MTFDASTLQSSRRSKEPRDPNNTFSASGTYRRRGPKNRFMKQASRDSEIDLIIAMMTAGTKVPDIAEALKISVATVYRRINRISQHVPPVPPKMAEHGRKRVAALLGLLHANVAQAQALGLKRQQRHVPGPTSQDKDDALAVEAMRLAADLLRAELDYLKHIGLFDLIRAEGSALVITRGLLHPPTPCSEVPYSGVGTDDAATSAACSASR